jgi:hypothetical protein
MNNNTYLRDIYYGYNIITDNKKNYELKNIYDELEINTKMINNFEDFEHPLDPNKTFITKSYAYQNLKKSTRSVY